MPAVSINIFGVFKMVMVQISRAQISEDVLYCMHFTNGFICMKIHQLYVIYQTELGSHFLV